jgi:hypothetical protein
MTNLFKKAACFTDIHFGAKNNSREHNNDCEDFVQWFIDEAKKRGCETCFFLGDWHQNRNSINVSTLNYTNTNLEKLNDAFEQTFFIIGNHDLYFREKREIHSLPMGKFLPRIKMIDDIFIQGDVAVVPWLVEDEWKKISKIKSKYMFGHFEIPGFKMNAMVEMPDHGGINSGHFPNQDLVFSGHFHKRQQKDNIHYIGNAFAHNYGDAWDKDRGAMFLDWDGEPEYVNWADGPKYINLSLSELIADPDSHLTNKTFAKVLVDIDISYEESLFIRETFMDSHKAREIKLIIDRNSDHTEDNSSADINFESIDKIVLTQIEGITSDNFDKKKLIEIYNSL